VIGEEKEREEGGNTTTSGTHTREEQMASHFSSMLKEGKI
jgi:hypothetical protein